KARNFASSTRTPCADVPRPGGRTTPSGGTLISHPAICAAVTGWPRFGVSTVVVPAQPPTTSDTSTHGRSRVDMLHLAVGLDGPGVDRVVVEDGVGIVLGDEAVMLLLDCARVVR